MINKRLISLLGDSMRFIWANVACQWGMLLCNILVTCIIGMLISDLTAGHISHLLPAVIVAAAAIALRYLLTVKASDMSFMASKDVKHKLRSHIYDKLIRFGVSYHEKVATAEAVQLAAEGVEQLETYYSAFLPQFFYSMLAPLTLFVLTAFIHFQTGIVLFLLVPLIPAAIMAVQKIAKKMLAGYWGQYAKMGSSFLENLQGLTTLKIYQADAYKAGEMAKESEAFRRITMKVLTMQLNSVTIMDIIAYGGAAAGLILSLSAFSRGEVSFFGCFVIILLAAEFFLPLRALGSYFHTAMNGMAASGRMFRILDMDEPVSRTSAVGANRSMRVENLCFSYDGERQILKDINMNIPQNSFTAIVGESGSGKSTIASILTGRSTGYTGAAVLGSSEISKIAESDLMKAVTYISHASYIFKGSVAENLRLGKQDANDEELWSVLRQVRIAEFFETQQGLMTHLDENGSNLSGGQRQRLALARALLHDTPVYIFDEATSNIDIESETEILSVIHSLAGRKTIVMITHRLQNAVPADCIFVMEHGRIAGCGCHEDLIEKCPAYAKLWNRQQKLERYGRADI